MKTNVVSGMRPTGKLHLGHYHGVLKNWLELQDKYDCFFFIADWHAMTTEYKTPKVVRESVREVLVDWLSVGIDPNKVTLFVQSAVKEHAELQLLLSMITPLGWLERVPTYKEQLRELETREIATHGFIGYPVLQTADIALYDGKGVPVGDDQVSHIELAREIVRRFNHLYGETLIEPKAMVTSAPKLLGPDRRKMSKSYDNCLYLSDSSQEIQKKIMSAITDENRKRREDPGNPDVCLIFDYHKLQTKPDLVKQIDHQCRMAEIGCVEDKKMMVKILNDFLEPIRERRAQFLKRPDDLNDILKLGNQKASRVAQRTMERVRKAMGV